MRLALTSPLTVDERLLGIACLDAFSVRTPPNTFLGFSVTMHLPEVNLPTATE